MLEFVLEHKKFTFFVVLSVLTVRWLDLPLSAIFMTLLKKLDSDSYGSIQNFMDSYYSEVRKTTMPGPQQDTYSSMPNIDNLVYNIIGSRLTPVELGIFVLAITVALPASYVTVRVVFRRLIKPISVKAVYTFRGIQCEAAIPGSVLDKGEKPAFQVEIRRVGILSSVPIGHGNRVTDTLATPKHVIKEAIDKDGNILLQAGDKSVIVKVDMRDSRLADDVVYLTITNKVWSILGVAAAKRRVIDHKIQVIASCTYNEGRSTGPLRQSPVPGMLYFFGTTMPGSSGAAYTYMDTFVGMHLGAAVGANTGVCSALIFAEIPEASTDPLPRHRLRYIPSPPTAIGKIDNEARYVRRVVNGKVKYVKISGGNAKDNASELSEQPEEKGSWNSNFVDQLRYMDNMSGRSPWLDDQPMDYDEQIIFDDESSVGSDKGRILELMRKLTVDEREKLFDEAFSEPVKPKVEFITVSNQSPGGETVTYRIPESQSPSGNLGSIVRNLQVRVKALEEKQAEHVAAHQILDEKMNELKDSIAKYGTPEELKRFKESVRILEKDMEEIEDDATRIGADVCYLTPNSFGAFQCEACAEAGKTYYADDARALHDHRVKAHGYKKWSKFGPGEYPTSCSIAKTGWGPNKAKREARRTQQAPNSNQVGEAKPPTTPTTTPKPCPEAPKPKQVQGFVAQCHDERKHDSIFGHVYNRRVETECEITAPKEPVVISNFKVPVGAANEQLFDIDIRRSRRFQIGQWPSRTMTQEEKNRLSRSVSEPNEKTEEITTEQEIQPESAFGGDLTTEVGTEPFLGKRTRRQRRRSKRSKSTSKLSVAAIQYQSLVESQKSTNTYLQNMSKSLEKLVQDMNGQSLDTTQN